MSFIATRHGDLFYLTVGTGRPLILLHGNTMTAASQERLAARFADTYQVLSFDLLGHGHSARPAKLFTSSYFTLQGEALADALEQLFPKTASPVLGMSAGGITALNAAKVAPAAINALILDSVFSYVSRDTLLAHRARVRETSAAWERYMQGQHGEGWWATLQAGLLTVIERLEGTGEIITPGLSQLRIPTLIFQGGRDNFCPEAQGRAIAAAIPGAQLRYEAEAGHVIAWHDPAAFCEEVKTFLAQQV